MEPFMLRRIILGLTTGIALAVSALGSVTPADAQAAPLCTRFGADASSLDGWGPCTAAPNIVVTTSNVGSIGGAGDYHLHLRDTAGASAACSTNGNYLGDWNQKMGGCGQFCFDFKVFQSGTPPGPITPSFTIWSGPVNHATFVANFTVTSNDPWRQHICAPVNLAGSPPSNAQGHWVVTGGTWNSIITAVTMIQLPIDWTSDPSEEAGYDNLCMNPQSCEPPPPVIDGCLKDSKVTVKCNPDGSYTVTLTGAGITGTDMTMTSQTPGVSVTPPQQPWAATTTWTVTGASAGQTVILSANATKVGGGSAEGTDQCCSGEIKIVMPECPKPKVGEVVVEKKVKNNTRASTSVINSLVFPIGLTCGLPSTLNVSFGLNNGGSHTENNIPYGSLCTVTELVSTLPPVPVDACGQGSTAVWATPVIAPASATINAPITAFTVVNELDCKPIDVKTGSLIVTKKVSYIGPIALPSLTYPVTVTCGGTVTNLNLVDGVPQTVSNIPFNTSCSVVEGSVATPANVCPPRTIPAWSTAYVPPTPVIVTTTTPMITVINTMTCKPILIDACSPPMVSGPVAGQCICPQGTVLRGGECVKQTTCQPPMLPGPVAGVCVCPQGTVQKGRECVRQIDCRPPMVPNAASKACVCPQGTVQRGRECVKPIVCNAPAHLNRRGACECPGDMVARGNSCIERERKPPAITPGDIIRNIPGGGRDNSEGPRGGGRDNPAGPRGGGSGPGDLPGRR
jgi:hypothetical protein